MQIGVLDTPRAAWVVARAFGRGRIRGVLALLIALIMVLAYLLRRGAYMTDSRDGVVFFARHRPVVDALLSAAVMAVGVVALALVAFLIWPLTSAGAVVVILGPYIWVLIGAAVFATSGGAMTMPVGPETPKGQRWAVSALSQLPGTRMSGLLLARSLTEGVPAGAVVVAVAASHHHLRAYKVLGFSEGRRRRVYRVG